MTECTFCKIVRKAIPNEILFEDDMTIAFNDISPMTPVHILIIPRQHIESINDLPEGKEGEEIAGRLIQVAKKLAKEQGIDKNGYKLLFRTGEHGGQEVPHIHLHLMGGARLSEGIKPIK